MDIQDLDVLINKAAEVAASIDREAIVKRDTLNGVAESLYPDLPRAEAISKTLEEIPSLYDQEMPPPEPVAAPQPWISKALSPKELRDLSPRELLELLNRHPELYRP
jgi:hypothetical protein